MFFNPCRISKVTTGTLNSMEFLETAPSTGSFVPLAEHQSTTPASFHSGPPVLHYYSDRCKVIVLDNELQHAPALASLVAKASVPSHSNEPADEGTNGTQLVQKTIEEVDVWVTSDKLLMFSNACSAGLSIDYRSISIHATQSFPAPSPSEPASQSLYMQLVPSLDSNPSEDEPPDTVSLTIIPTAAAPPPSTSPTAHEDEALETEDQPQLTPVQALYKALSDCSDLHPDPVEDDDEAGEGMSRLMQAGLAIPGTSDGSMPPAMPGSGGWITAENMHEFVDDDGNWIEAQEMDDGEGELGPGAGTVRSRPDDADTDGDGEGKWQRTS